MSIEITSRDTFEPTVIIGNFRDVINELELAATKNNHFALFVEERSDGSTGPVALEMRNITRIRSLDEADDGYFVGRH